MRLSARPSSLAAQCSVLVTMLALPGLASAAPPTSGELRVRADRAAVALTAYPFLNGRVTISGGFSRLTESFHAGALAYSWLRAAGRTEDPVLAGRLADSASQAIAWTVRSYSGDPFALFSLAKAFPLVVSLAASQSSLAVVLPRLSVFLRTVGAASVKSGPTCTRNDECFSNWSLMRAVGISSVIAAAPPGKASPGSYLADPGAARAWLRELLQSKVPANLGPKVTGWSDSRPGCVLSDPPSNPHAYHVFSTWLLSQLARETRAWPEIRDSVPLGCTRRMLAMLASPDGDLAWSGRSQLQSWTLAAGIAASADASSDEGQAVWPALAERLWERVSSADYADPLDGFFAITPSARERTLVGLDGYVDPSQYNGLTAMLLNLAADSIQRSPFAGTGSIPSDSAGGVADPTGLHSVIQRSGDVWWIWRTDSCGSDLRCDAGLLQVKVRRDGVWRNLLSARPLLGGSAVIGPSLSIAGKFSPFLVESAETTGARTVLRGSFGDAKTTRSADVEVTSTGRGVRISWPVGKLQEYGGAFPLVGAVGSTGGLVSQSASVALSPGTTLRTAVAAPGALSASASLNGWRLKTKSAGIASITIEAGA